MRTLGGAVPLLSAVAAVGGLGVAIAALVLGITKTARLRRREQLFRESMVALAADDPRRNIVVSLHRLVMAELIARHLTPSWRAVWPWLAWTSLALWYAIAGYYSVRYLATQADHNLSGLISAAFADAETALLALAMTLTLFPQCFQSLAMTLRGRAALVADFYAGRGVARPEGLLDKQIRDESRLRLAQRYRQLIKEEDRDSRRSKGSDSSFRYDGSSAHGLRRAARDWLESVIPVILAASFGFLVGIGIWLRRQPSTSGQQVQVDLLTVFAILVLSISGVLTLLVAQKLAWDLRRIRPSVVHLPTEINT